MYIGSLPLAFACSVLLAIWQYAMLACWKHNVRTIFWQAKLPFCRTASNTAKRIIAVPYRIELGVALCQKSGFLARKSWSMKSKGCACRK
jgi:hypothetical protein